MPEKTLYNTIGKGYNQTRKADPYILERLYTFLNPLPGSTYLDIGCGTGNYTVCLAENGGSFIGIDPSELMLAQANAKTSSVKWIHATADSIPLADRSIYGAIATLTIHHWPDLEKAFREIARVLRPGAKLVIFSFTPQQEKGYWFNHFFPKMMERSQHKAISLQTVESAATTAGFTLLSTEKYFVQEDLQDMFGYSGKHNPEIYFDPAIRSGISSFSILTDDNEVEDGLKKLRTCIDKGEFEQVKKSYNNEDGDYLFIVLKRSE